MNKTYTIKQVSELTDISELLIRAWENRYNIVNPMRTDSNRRLYSEEDINKLRIVKKLTDNGYRIKNIANLSFNDLSELISGVTINKMKSEIPVMDENYYEVIHNIIHFTRNYDSRNIEILLNNSAVRMTRIEYINNILMPLIELTGKYWESGIFKISHEHLISTLIKKSLLNFMDAYKISETSPKLVAVTPKGQYHELGSLIGSTLASSQGWDVIYLGPSLPAEEIADVVNKTGAGAVFLSLVYPYDDPYLSSELYRLKNYINQDISIIVSGKALGSYINVLNEIGAVITESSTDFLNKLESIRIKKGIKDGINI